MAQYGFYFDMARCIGCKTCQIACKDVNDLPVGILYRKATNYEVGNFPNVGAFSFSTSCNHCANPACVANCPVGAMQKDEETGIVSVDQSICIGCRTCTLVCPYGVPQMREDLGVSSKCDACARLRALGEQPACVNACPARALDFGDLEELAQKYGPELANEFPVMGSAEATQPSVLIKLKPCALEPEYRLSFC
ncbi:MAG: 4Fe-4S dicluster domain-containing protein [Coriobacteriales bacterium]|nr:4Fe-4S dicluster domain-containing protein [Coriobacteriales bacterium]